MHPRPEAIWGVEIVVGADTEAVLMKARPPIIPARQKLSV